MPLQMSTLPSVEVVPPTKPELVDTTTAGCLTCPGAFGLGPGIPFGAAEALAAMPSTNEEAAKQIPIVRILVTRLSRFMISSHEMWSFQAIILDKFCAD